MLEEDAHSVAIACRLLSNHLPIRVRIHGMTDIATFAANPAAFRNELMIPSADRGARKFGDVMADFQRQDFAKLDPALISLAKGKKPKIGRYWWERTKGASKDSDAATVLLWLLTVSPRPLLCQVG